MPTERFPQNLLRPLSLLSRTFCIGVATLSLLPSEGGAAKLQAETQRAHEVTAEMLELTRDGKALLSITVAPTASAETVRLAEELARGLERISGAAFAVSKGTQAKGIVVGTGTDFPGVLPEDPDAQDPLTTQEVYTLQTRPEGLLVIGKTELAIQNAIWDLLYQFGFRQFFPGPNWEIWPRHPELKIALNKLESPSFFYRRFAYSGATGWKENAGVIDQWKVRNRMVPAMNLRLGHAYGAIVRRNKEFFAEHPEVFARNPDGTQGKQFDPTQEQLLKVVAEDAIAQFRKSPKVDAVSVEPFDGGGWRRDSPLGSPSNQAVTLANHTAQAIQSEFPGKKVTMLAYHRHSLPPEIDLDPNVIVMAQTYAINQGLTIEQVMKGWQSRKAVMGVSDFLSLWVWNKDVPGAKSKATDLRYLSQQIPAYHQWGARYWNSGLSSAWAPQGLGYYLASRVLWSIEEAKRFPELVEDFYTRAFEDVAPEMRTYYEKYVLSSGRQLFSEDLLGRMYRHLAMVHEKTKSDAVKRRICDLIAHVRTLELYMAYQNQSDDAQRQQAYDEMCQFVYGIREREMVSSRAFIYWVPKWDKRVELNEAWKDAPNISDADLVAMLPGGIERNELLEFEVAGFSKELMPFTEKAAGAKATASKPLHLVGANTLYLYKDAESDGFDLSVKGATLWAQRGPVRITLFADENPELDEPVAVEAVPADKTVHAVRLKSRFAGLHRLEISDSGGGSEIALPEGTKAVLPAAPDEKMRFVSSYRYDVAFFVPKGTRKVGGFSEGPIGHVEAPDGKEVFSFKEMGKPGYFAIDVPEGTDGQWWWIRKAQKAKLLLTVPPYLARSPAEGLVPKEVQTGKEGEHESP